VTNFTGGSRLRKTGGTRLSVSRWPSVQGLGWPWESLWVAGRVSRSAWVSARVSASCSVPLGTRYTPPV